MIRSPKISDQNFPQPQFLASFVMDFPGYQFKYFLSPRGYGVTHGGISFILHTHYLGGVDVPFGCCEL